LTSYDLLGLDDLKQWLGIEGVSDDALLASLISQISRAILTYLNRPAMAPTTYQDVFDGSNRASILLRYWPVQSISACTIDGRPIAQSSSTSQAGYVLEPAAQMPPGAMQRLSLRHDTFHAGIQNIAISYFAGYRLSETFTVPKAAPFTISVGAPFGPFCSDLGVAYEGGSAFVQADEVLARGQYEAVSGVYSFAAEDAGAQIEISYGYVPSDIAMAAREWAAERYSYHARIGQSSKSLGGQETVSFIVKDVPDFVARILQPYRCVVVP
jgi:hypothetical protein